MHVDHLTFVATSEGLESTVASFENALGCKAKNGGFHPRFGTRNFIVPLADSRYIEIVDVLDHPSAEKAVYGQAVRECQSRGGGWLGWAISVDDISSVEARLNRSSIVGSRQFPDGRCVEWRQIGVQGLLSDHQLPYFLKWTSDSELLPSALRGDVRLSTIEFAGSAQRVAEWIGVDVYDILDGVELAFQSPHGAPGILAATFEVPGKGQVRI